MGIWLLWDSFMVDMKIVGSHHQYIHTRIRLKLFYTFVYGSPNISSMDELWEEMIQLSTDRNDPWLAIGDFNVYPHPHEKSEGGPVNVYHAGFDDDNGFHHPKEGECECISCKF